MNAVPAAKHPLLTLNEVGVTFPQQQQPVLDDISLQVHAGEFLAIVGPSGCGKSTLLRLLAGLLSPTTGTVTQAANNTTKLPLQEPGQIAMVFQEARLLPWRTVLENMQLPFVLTGLPIDQPRIEHLLKLIGLQPEDYRKKPAMLSGGMKMRVAVARALVLNPQLLLLDEPFAAVDDLLREQLNEELLSLQQQFGFAAVLVTHHLAEAAFLSERLLVMSALPGRIVQEIPSPWSNQRPASLREQPAFAQFCGQIRQMLFKNTEKLPSSAK